MRIALLSDIHGNAIALDICLRRLRDLHVDILYFLGDAVGYLPAAREVLDRLEAEGVHCQKGNHERMLLAPAKVARELEESYRIQQAYSQLDAAHFRMVSSWPTFQEVFWRGRSMLLVHGSPRSMLDGYVYPDANLTEYHDLGYDVVVTGHTHRPFVRQCAGKVFVNTGSVGLPRDQGNLSSFAVYDGDHHTFEIVRVSFDVNKVLAAYGTQVADSVRACLLRTNEKG